MATATEPATAVDEDFYEVEALLEPADGDLVHRVRAFMRAEVEPIINDYWTRAEFPFGIVPGLRELGIVGLAYDGYGFPGRSHLVSGLVSMELARVDPSIATFMGVQGGLAAGSILQCGSAEQKQRWLPGDARLELIGAFAPDRAGGRLRGGRRADHHRPPGRRRVGAGRAEEVDRQRHLRRPGRGLGPATRRTARSRASWWRRARPASARRRWRTRSPCGWCRTR